MVNRSGLFPPFDFKNPPPSEFVSSLIDSETRRWREDIIRNTFYDDIVQSILKLPLGSSERVDSIFCNYSKDSKYSVKSGYHCAYEHNLINADYASTSNMSNTFWKNLWSLNIQPKVKHCVWGAITETLPCQVTLKRKHIDVETACVFCQREEDTLIHIFKFCRFTKLIWKSLGLGVSKLIGDTCSAWFYEVFQTLSMLEKVTFCTGIWCIWGEHNRRTHGDRGFPVERVTSFIRQQEAHKPVVPLVPSSSLKPISTPSWKPPGRGIVKLKVDATISSSMEICTAGFVLQNDEGEVMMSGAAPIGLCLFCSSCRAYEYLYCSVFF